MSFSKKQLEDFIKDNPQHEEFLLSFYEEKVKNRTNLIEEKRKNFDKQKDTLTFLIKSKHVIKGNKPTLTSPSFSLRNVKYKVETLDKNDPDYKLLKRSLAVEKWCKNDSDQKERSINIYSVKPNKKRKMQSSDPNTSNLLLLHGTKAPNVNGILKEDFIPSKKGKYGPGIYHTDSAEYASNYSDCYLFENRSVKKITYLFVNKVQQAEPPKSPRKVIGDEAYEEYKKKDPVLQIFN